MGTTAFRRTFRGWVAAGAVLVAGIGFGVGSAAHADDDPCQATSFAIAKVGAACKTGGRKAAKAVMKTAVKKAKAAGETMNCKTCHKDLKSFSLTDNAVTDLKKWM